MSSVKKSLLKLAAYYGHDLTSAQLDVFAEQIARHLTDSELAAAIVLYVDNPDNAYFPRPMAKLITLIKKPVEDKDQAQNVANLIKRAVIDHQSAWVDGYFDHYDDSRNPVFIFFNNKKQVFTTWQDAATSEIGDLGVKIVERMGGWKRVCQSCNEQPDGVFTAQIIKFTEAVLSMATSGHLEKAPALPAPSNVVGLLQIKNIKPA